MDRSVPEPDIEKMLTRLVAETRQLLVAHEAALRALSSELAQRGRMTGAEIANLLAEHAVESAVQPEAHQIIPPYAATLRGDG